MVSSSAKETGADIGCTLIGIVFNSPLNYNSLPKQSKLKKQSGNETVEGDVSFHARQILIKIEGGRVKELVCTLVKAVMISVSTSDAPVLLWFCLFGCHWII